MKYQAILFDLDGTVLDTLRDVNASVNRTLARFGYPPQCLDDTRRFLGNGSRALLTLSLPAGTAAARVEELLAWYLPYYDRHANDTTAPYAGIPSLLGALRGAGARMAIVSNKPDGIVKELVRQHFPGLMETAVGEDEAHGVRRKPYPDTLLAAAEKLGAAPEDCLYVGDSEVDVLTAVRAGMDCASVLWGFRSREELADAGGKLFFASPGELKDYLLDE